MSFVPDLLSDDFTEQELFGEVFGADHDTVAAGRAAGGDQSYSKCGRKQSMDEHRAIAIIARKALKRRERREGRRGRGENNHRKRCKGRAQDAKKLSAGRDTAPDVRGKSRR